MRRRATIVTVLYPHRHNKLDTIIVIILVFVADVNKQLQICVKRHTKKLQYFSVVQICTAHNNLIEQFYLIFARRCFRRHQNVILVFKQDRNIFLVHQVSVFDKHAVLRTLYLLFHAPASQLSR